MSVSPSDTVAQPVNPVEPINPYQPINPSYSTNPSIHQFLPSKCRCCRFEHLERNTYDRWLEYRVRYVVRIRAAPDHEEKVREKARHFIARKAPTSKIKKSTFEYNYRLRILFRGLDKAMDIQDVDTRRHRLIVVLAVLHKRHSTALQPIGNNTVESTVAEPLEGTMGTSV
ncbi:hypothetical protein BGZ47_000384 [Haplosporangium gracile]|nr:hypothetical protein BGZ47_000384 [Haplosporangium gracile]